MSFKVPRPSLAPSLFALALVAVAVLIGAGPAFGAWRAATTVPASAPVAPAGFGSNTATVADRSGTVVAAWDTGGFGTSQIYAAVRPSGQDWSEPANLVAEPGGTAVPGTKPTLATSPDGSTTVVWAEQNFAGGSGVWAATRASSGDWGGPVNVSAGAAVAGSGGAGPRIVIDRAGNSTVVWQVGLALFSATKPAGGAWGAPVLVWSGAEGADNALSGIAAAVDTAGAVTVVWRAGLNNQNVVYAKRRATPGGAWGALEQIVVPPDYYYDFEAAASQAGGSGGREVGEVTVAFTNGESGAAARVFAATRAGDGPGGGGPVGSWTVKELTGSAWGSPPDVTYDARGRALIAFADQSASPQKVVLASREAGAWAAVPETVAVADPASESITDTDLVVDAEGNVTASWVRTGGEGSLVQAARRGAGGAWSAAETLSSDSEAAAKASLAVDPIGAVTAVWGGETSGVDAATFDHTPAPRLEWTANGLFGSNNMRSWINYLGGNAGVELSAGAGRIADVDPYSFRFGSADAWVDAASGQTVIAGRGALRFSYPAHYIDIRIVDPEVRIAADGKSGLLVADGQGSGSMAEAIEKGEAVAIPFADRALLSLDLEGIEPRISADGATQTWTAVPATVHPDGVGVLTYAAGTAYGFLSITAPSPLPTRSPPTPTPTPTQPAPPGLGPDPRPAKPSLKRLGKKARVNGKGFARVARASCPADGGACTVAAPKRVAVKIAGQRYWAKVLAPKRIAAGSSAVVRVKLGAAAVVALGGRSVAIVIPATLANAGGSVKRFAATLSRPGKRA